MKKLAKFSVVVAVAVLALAAVRCGDWNDRARVSTPVVELQPEPTPGPSGQAGGGCELAIDCDDRDKSTVDTCVDGACVHVSLQCNDGFTLNELGACVKAQTPCPDVADQDLCTLDSCDPANGEVLHVVKSCDDNDDTTEDSCDPATGDCQHGKACGNCADDDPCSLDNCDGATGSCTHTPLLCPALYVCVAGTCQFQCGQNADCGDGNGCTIDSCEDGECVNALRDCGDDDDTTIDLCLNEDDPDTGKPFVCVNAATDCTGGCSDGNGCTADSCQAGKCVHETLPCGEWTVCKSDKAGESGECVPAPCQGTINCDDQNPCTTESCEFGVCVYQKVACAEKQVCDAATGVCTPLEECPGGCDDADDATLDSCQEGKCLHHQPLECGPGTLLNPMTGVCEAAKSDPSCVDGTVACQQFEAGNIVVYAVCAGGAWWVVESCGPIKTGKCAEGNGCMSLPSN